MGTILETKGSPAVLGHINMQQGIINRMAANSASCKTLTITILAAILVLLADKKICICNIHADDFRKIYDGINYKQNTKYISWCKKYKDNF